METLKQLGPEEIVFSGKIFEIVRTPMGKGNKIVVFETARRSPGVRLIIQKGDEILLTKEYRYELKDYDYRLPGGKVFDTLSAYSNALNSGKDLIKEAAKAAERECLEETGILPKKLAYFYTAGTGGTTMKMDTYYFVAEEFEEKGKQNLEIGEIIQPEWKTTSQVKKLCLEGKVNEDKTTSALLKYLYKIGKI